MPIPFMDYKLFILRLKRLWTMTLYDNHITYMNSHIQCNFLTFHMNNKYVELCNKHVKDILYIICSNHLFSEYIY
jgi:hypothetical protein